MSAETPQPKVLRRRWSALVAVLGLSLLGVTAATSVTAADDLLPDLTMAVPYNLRIEGRDSGRHKLRFGTIVWNQGNGPLDVRANDRVGEIMNNLVQVVHTRDGGAREHRPEGGFAFYAGDGHDHWHISRFVVVRLYPTFSISRDELGPTYAERGLRKIGFCLTDLVRAPAALRPPNSARRAAFPVSGCGVRESTSLRIGISAGYGDDYKPFFNHQSVDITGLPSGIYRLCVTTNENGMWLEQDGGNNSAWVDIDLNSQKWRMQTVASGTSDCNQPEPVMYGVGG